MPEGMSLEDAAYHTAHGYPGGVAALAVRMGLPANTLTHKVNPRNETHFLRPPELISLQALSGNAAVLHSMARTLGYVCTPAAPDEADGDPVEAFMHLQRAQGEYTAAVADAMLTRHPTPNAVRRVEVMAQDVLARTGHLVAVLRGRMRKAPDAGGVR